MHRHVRLMILGAWCAVVCWTVAPVAQTPATAFADLVLTNGKIVTVDERFTIAQAIAVKGERIVAVGTNQDISRLAGPNTRRIDLRGRTVIPGLIDNHMHLLRAATTWQLNASTRAATASTGSSTGAVRESTARSTAAAGRSTGAWTTAQRAACDRDLS